MLRRTDVVVIGAGQAGLAMSRCLTDAGLDHVVLERGRVGERWRTERWDSLRLLTPRWQTRLPGWRYQGPDPDGYMSVGETITHLDGYARSFAAPVETGVTVRLVAPSGGGYRVATNRGAWLADNVVIATGACDTPLVPEMAGRLAPRVRQLVPSSYRNPAALPEGGVLVVGASASGVQIAAELRRAGREVTLATGHHTRVPRRYRGRDIMRWLEATGILGEAAVSRRTPSLQLSAGGDVDLPALHALGVRLVGRAEAVDGERVRVAGDLAATSAAADARLERLLARIDAFIHTRGLDAGPATPFARAGLTAPADILDLRGVGTVVWATGYVRRYPWLAAPVLYSNGELRQEGGITPAPGLYTVGQPMQRTRKSTFIDGVGDDARIIASHIAGRSGRRAAA